MNLPLSVMSAINENSFVLSHNDVGFFPWMTRMTRMTSITRMYMYRHCLLSSSPVYYWKTSLCSINNSTIWQVPFSVFLGRKLIFEATRTCLYFQRPWRRHHSCALKCRACRRYVVLIARENADIIFVLTEWQGNNLKIPPPPSKKVEVIT